jgi:hypothetical protein
MATKPEPKEKIIFPEGRVINSSLFELDKFNEKATPSYKIEMAFDPDDVEGEGTVEDKIIEAVIKEWGKEAEQQFLDGEIIGILDGDKLAARREKKGKNGDAYKGKRVIRASTTFNKDGQAGAPGGIQVFLPDLSEVSAVNREKIYNGCYGQMACTIHCYTNADGERAIKFYLAAFQKRKDGEKLVSAADYSNLFEPVGRKAAEAGERRRRAG